MGSAADSSPMIMLLHDGELQDVRSLLTELGTPFVEREGELTDVDRRAGWDLVIASHKRIRKFQSHDKSRKTTRIAIIDSDSRTLQAMMRRIGVDFVVVRPVHAAAIRLLILHALYRGPERRRNTRVTVGSEVSFRYGLFKRRAVLADLSLRGCRLLTSASVPRKKKLKITIPSALGQGRSYTLAGTVQRVAATGGAGANEIAIAFEQLSPAEGQNLRKTYESHARGPARLSGNAQGDSLRAYAPCESMSARERRTTARYEYAKRVVALGEEATRVLLCRDISMGGMRVEPNETLVPGDVLRIALHAGPRSEPLVVSARVTRDEGEAGLVLTFHHLSDADSQDLEKLVDRLPIAVAGSSEGEVERDGGMVVSEIVERIAG